MAEAAFGDDRQFKFTVGEVTGAVGDSITVLPVVVAVAALTDLDLAVLLLGFAVFQVVWGVRYGLPMSVEPMKALAALAIAGALSGDELLTAGLLAGFVLLVLGKTRSLERLTEHVGEPVVRGIQVAVALLLAETGVGLVLSNPTLAGLALFVALVMAGAGYRKTSALVILALGFAFAGFRVGLPTASIPAISFALPRASALGSGVLSATAGQLAMTVGNAAVATSLLLSDLLEAEVSPDELATSMGVMNLLAVPFGAMPMCHGSGGVAGKYTFGARTATANLVLGLFYALAALFAVHLVAAFPLSVLGVVLLLVAVELGRAGLRTDDRLLAVGIGILGLLTNVGIAFVVGVLGWWLRRKV
ncbi:Sulfate permease, MFS superfamily [Haladaptatus litoreus]|uniref:Sulfate permease, MFS superfamily n=1 Tax=Haladaptatus litoreus TaxID=553468 RepID=A0A1N6WZN1_9EURY|nr:putative sulfate/molybdate transporter [Haladaptatus litoreus]SIQ95475.1 Sulfate permease, MFS superfamily [Haladaptatus litoreus]